MHGRARGADGYTVEITRFISDRLIEKIAAYNQKRAANNGRKKAVQSELDESDDEEENGGNGAGGASKPLEIERGRAGVDRAGQPGLHVSRRGPGTATPKSR